MKSTTALHYFWKVPLCGLLFFMGFIPGSQLAAWIGLPTPNVSVDADPATITQYTLLVSLILALGLAALARGLTGSFLSRWLSLFSFTWIAYGVNNYFEALIFSTLADAAAYTLVLYLPASLLCSAAIAWLIPTEVESVGFLAQTRAFFAERTIGSWAWRLVFAYLAFPLVYFLIGSLISPIVLPYYLQGADQLALPSWNQILPVLALRSLLFLLVCLPILMTWNLSNRRLFFSLGLTLFLLVGGLSMLSAFWLSPVLRITHGLEILIDEMVYAGALVVLLGRPESHPASSPTLVPAHHG